MAGFLRPFAQLDYSPLVGAPFLAQDKTPRHHCSLQQTASYPENESQLTASRVEGAEEI
jgi:hypothetical protein